MLRVDKQAEAQISDKIPILIKKPAFAESGPLWVKQKHASISASDIDGRRYQFIKMGKTFGFETRRYLIQHKGYLFYYNDEHEQQYKGYCPLQNTYVQWFAMHSGKYLLYMTNGSDNSYFYFENASFWKECQRSMSQFIIQLDCRERYQFVEQLGKGSFSKVYLVRNKQTNKEFAAKVINKLDKNKGCTKKVVVEQRRILRLIQSEYVYKFQELYEENQSYIVMLQYLPGKNLMNLHKQKKIKDAQTIKKLLRQILMGIRDIHKANIIHRDLKPQNILINPNTLKPCIIDFGLSLLLDSYSHPKLFKRCGTMGYMAPQVIENSGEVKKIYGVKSDIFSFGIIAHMLLLGTNPLKGEDYDSTYLKNRECNIQLNKKLIYSLYGEQCFIFLTKALSKHPQFRYDAEQALNSLFLHQSKEKDKEQSSSTVQQKKKIEFTVKINSS